MHDLFLLYFRLGKVHFVLNRNKNSKKYSGPFTYFNAVEFFAGILNSMSYILYVVQIFMQIAFTKNKMCLPTYDLKLPTSIKITQGIFKLNIVHGLT